MFLVTTVNPLIRAKAAICLSFSLPACGTRSRPQPWAASASKARMLSPVLVENLCQPYLEKRRLLYVAAVPAECRAMRLETKTPPQGRACAGKGDAA